MRETKVFEDFYQFNSGNENIPITFNQYLLSSEEPVLFHTGNSSQVTELVPRLKNLLGGKELSYIFISHFESDECGGINYLMQHFPKAKPVCSSTTAMQFKGFGFNYDLIVKKPGEVLETKDYRMEFVAYPSEMHLWEGLLCIETKRGIFFSADLFIHWDKMKEEKMNSSWESEVNGITAQSVPSPEMLKTLKDTLLKLPVNSIATGHGSYIYL